jgi:hypothetical protein
VVTDLGVATALARKGTAALAGVSMRLSPAMWGPFTLIPAVTSDPRPAAPVRCFVLDAPPKARTPRRRRGEEIWSNLVGWALVHPTIKEVWAESIGLS